MTTADHLKSNPGRFLGIAKLYDSTRPTVPTLMCDLIASYLQHRPLLVVDLGCGSGLSCRPWIGRAERIVGIDPNPEMLEVAKSTIVDDSVDFQSSFAHDTKIETGSADIVTAATSFHWFEPPPTLAEISRILKPGGILAVIYQSSWAPSTGFWAAEKAFEETLTIADKILIERSLSPGLKKWEGHLESIKANSPAGTFAWTREISVSSQEIGSASRLCGLAESHGSVATCLKAGITREELGLDKLRMVSESSMGSGPRAWNFSFTAILAFRS